jgi:hypothetical protein
MPASRTRSPRSCHGRRSPSSTARDRHPCRSRICTYDSNVRLRPGRNRHSLVTAHPADRLFPAARSMIASPNPQEGEALMLTTFRGAVAAAVLAAALARCPGRGGDRRTGGDVRPAHHGRLQGQLATSARGNGEVQGRHLVPQRPRPRHLLAPPRRQILVPVDPSPHEAPGRAPRSGASCSAARHLSSTA